MNKDQIKFSLILIIVVGLSMYSAHTFCKDKKYAQPKQEQVK